MTSSSEDSATDAGGLPPAEFAAVFSQTPGLYLILDPSFTIVAANDAYRAATMTVLDDIVGRHLFEVFPDNPGDSAADGVQNLRASLLAVLKSRRPDRMSIQKYGIERRSGGGFEVRYWSVFNVPVLGPDGYVKWIIHSIEDVTEAMTPRSEFSARRGALPEHRILAHLRDTQRALAAERGENAQLRETLRRQARS